MRMVPVYLKVVLFAFLSLHGGFSLSGVNLRAPFYHPFDETKNSPLVHLTNVLAWKILLKEQNTKLLLQKKNSTSSISLRRI